MLLEHRRRTQPGTASASEERVASIIQPIGPIANATATANTMSVAAKAPMAENGSTIGIIARRGLRRMWRLERIATCPIGSNGRFAGKDDMMVAQTI